MAPSYSNAHAIMNAAVKLTLDRPASSGALGASGMGAGGTPPTISSASVVFGYPGAAGWACHRAAGAECALAGA